VGRSRKRTAPDTEDNVPVNWLAHLDEWAKTASPATIWRNPYGYFPLTRYPRLRPHDDPAGRRTYLQHLGKQVSDIDANPEAAQAIEGLSLRQRSEVAALVFDCTLDLQEHTRWRGEDENYESLTRQAERLARNLESCKRSMRKAFDHFASATSGLTPMLDAEKIRWELENHIAAVEATILTSKLKGAVKRSSYYQAFADDPTALAMVKLFWLFHYGCRLSVGKSEVRVALIRNGLWSEYTKSTRYAVGGPEEARGCDAVRKAVERFRLPQRTS